MNLPEEDPNSPLIDPNKFKIKQPTYDNQFNIRFTVDNDLISFTLDGVPRPMYAKVAEVLNVIADELRKQDHA